MEISVLLNIIITFASLLMSVIAIIVSISIAQRQNKVALFELRSDKLKIIEEHISKMYSWDYNHSWFLRLNLSKTTLEILFDKDFGCFYNNLESVSQKIELLWGDYEYAKNHGSCRNRDEDDIENEIYKLVDAIQKDFLPHKEKVIKKFLKI